jgi:ABC-type enterochelin transport system permease subunit
MPQQVIDPNGTWHIGFWVGVGFAAVLVAACVVGAVVFLGFWRAERRRPYATDYKGALALGIAFAVAAVVVIPGCWYASNYPI